MWDGKVLSDGGVSICSSRTRRVVPSGVAVMFAENPRGPEESPSNSPISLGSTQNPIAWLFGRDTYFSVNFELKIRGEDFIGIFRSPCAERRVNEHQRWVVFLPISIFSEGCRRFFEETKKKGRKL